MLSFIRSALSGRGVRELKVRVFIPGEPKTIAFQRNPIESIEQTLTLQIPQDATVGSVKKLAIDRIRQENPRIVKFGETHLCKEEAVTGANPGDLYTTWNGVSRSRAALERIHRTRQELLPDNAKLLGYRYGVQENDELHLYVDFVFHIKTNHPEFKNRILSLPLVQYLEPRCTLEDLKQAIHKETGLDPLVMHLIYKDQELIQWDGFVSTGTRSNLLSSGGIPHDATVFLWVHDWTVEIELQCPPSSFQVYADSHEDETSLRKRVETNKQWNGKASTDPLFVLKDGTVLSAGKSLRDQGVTDNCTILAIPDYKREIVDRGCTVPQAERRGITLKQLRQVAAHVLARCSAEGWWSTHPEQQKRKLRPSEVTLYDLMEHYVAPLTRERQCSYVEYIADPNDVDAQAPKYFCSHWWGEPVLDFVACVGQHAFDRDLPDTTSYWVCGYALSQSRLDEELKTVNDKKETPF